MKKFAGSLLYILQEPCNNTFFITLLSLLFAVPVGIGAAVYLTEYARRGNRLIGLVGLTAETLSGIPSIVYGLFGT